LFLPLIQSWILYLYSYTKLLLITTSYLRRAPNSFDLYKQLSGKKINSDSDSLFSLDVTHYLLIFFKIWSLRVLIENPAPKKAICCHFVVIYSAFNFTKLKPRYFQLSNIFKLSVVWCYVKSSLEFSKLLASCHHACMACHQFAINMTSLLSQCILLQFRKFMKSICSPDANSVHIRFQWQQIVDKLKTIHAVQQFVPYAKSRLAIWEFTIEDTWRES